MPGSPPASTSRPQSAGDSPLISTIRSPSLSPAFSAGPFSSTPPTKNPSSISIASNPARTVFFPVNSGAMWTSYASFSISTR